jgi:hypothetical protein
LTTLKTLFERKLTEAIEKAPGPRAQASGQGQV